MRRYHDSFAMKESSIQSISTTRPHRQAFAVATLLVLWTCWASSASAAERRTENVLLVTYDGLRRQELFAGADESLLNREHGGVRNVDALRARFWSDDPLRRREALLPFFWSVVAQQGQVFGAPEVGSSVRVTNGLYFSYPGYNEILSGVADARIDSNAKRPNPNLTVLEALHRKPSLSGRIAAFASWDVFPFILNEETTGIPVNAGWELLEYASPQSRMAELNALAAEIPHYWSNVRYDLFTFEGSLGYLEQRKPRLLYVAFGETDDWAHDGRYDLYLESARRTDDYIRRLWEALQSLPEYSGKTSLILASDHGRGAGLEDWRRHGKDVPGSELTWIAVIGPDTLPLGIRANTGVTQGQVAASVAALLGYDFLEDSPAAAPALPGLLQE